MKRIYVSKFAISLSHLSFEFSIASVLASSKKGAEDEAWRLIRQRYRSEAIQLLETIVIPDELVDAAYLARN